MKLFTATSFPALFIACRTKASRFEQQGTSIFSWGRSSQLYFSCGLHLRDGPDKAVFDQKTK